MAASSQPISSRQTFQIAQTVMDQINSTSEQNIRLLAKIVIIVTAALIASHGIVAGAAVVGLGYVLPQFIITYATNIAADPNSPLSIEKKVEGVVRAHLWQREIFPAVLYGVGGGFLYHGITAYFLEKTVLSALEGVLSALVGGLTASAGVVLSEGLLAIPTTQTGVASFIGLLDELNQNGASAPIRRLILELYQMQFRSSQERADKIDDFLRANPSISLLDLAQYFPKNDPVPTLFFHLHPLWQLLDNPQIPAEKILERLPPNIFDSYVSGIIIGARYAQPDSTLAAQHRQRLSPAESIDPSGRGDLFLRNQETLKQANAQQ